MLTGLTIRRAQPDERIAALRLAVTPASMPALERDRQVTAFLRYAERLNWSLDRLWVIAAGQRLHWSALAIPSPGRTAMLLVAHPPRPDRAAISDALAQISTTLFDEDVQLVQLLLTENDRTTATAAQDAQFESIATLQYMKCDLNQPEASHAKVTAPPTWQWHPYDDQQHAAFRDLIAASYEGSLDCSALAGRRDIDDVIAGHKAAGEFAPRNWWLLTDAQDLLGCILLARLPQRATMELVYLGVHPEHRGRGIGQALLQRGIETARRHRCDTLTLAVDGKNAPALRLYEAVGFTARERRHAMIHFKTNP